MCVAAITRLMTSELKSKTMIPTRHKAKLLGCLDILIWLLHVMDQDNKLLYIFKFLLISIVSNLKPSIIHILDIF